MLIEGDLIDRDIDMAKKYLKPLLNTVDDTEKPFIYTLYGKAMVNKPNYKVAFKVFKLLFALDSSKFNKEQNLALAESYFEYGKLLYEGKGIEADEEKAMEYFEKAKSKGLKKQVVNDYLSKMQNEEEKENESQKVDIIFLVDGTFSMKHFVESLRTNLVNVSKEWTEKNPNFSFMYGAVVYRDTAVSRLFKKRIIDKVNYYDLTDDVNEVCHFFSKIKLCGGGGDGPEDWASGFSYILNRINWRDDSVKIVIHICDAPGHGSHFSCKRGYYKRTIHIPEFNKKNKHEDNLKIYNTKIQKKPDKWIYSLICQLASKKIMFFCMNGRDNAMQCFQLTKDVYLKKGGLKYVIMNQFNCSITKSKDDVDVTDLNKNMKELLLNSVEISIDVIYNDVNEPTDFEIECNEQFDENLNEYEKNAPSKSGMQSEDSMASFSSLGSRSSTLNVFDFDSDFDDSDSDDETGKNIKLINLKKDEKDDDDDDDDVDDDNETTNKIVYSRRPKVNRDQSGRSNNNNRARGNYRGPRNRWHRGSRRGGRPYNRGGYNNRNTNKNTHNDDDSDENSDEEQTSKAQKNYNRNNRGGYNRGRKNTNRNSQKVTNNDSDQEDNSDEEQIPKVQRNYNRNNRGGYNRGRNNTNRNSQNVTNSDSDQEDNSDDEQTSKTQKNSNRNSRGGYNRGRKNTNRNCQNVSDSDSDQNENSDERQAANTRRSFNHNRRGQNNRRNTTRNQEDDDSDENEGNENTQRRNQNNRRNNRGQRKVQNRGTFQRRTQNNQSDESDD